MWLVILLTKSTIFSKRLELTTLFWQFGIGMLILNNLYFNWLQMQPWNVFHGKTNIHENNIKAKPKAISWRMHYQKKVLHNLLKYSRFQTFWSFFKAIWKDFDAPQGFHWSHRVHVQGGQDYCHCCGILCCQKWSSNWTQSIGGKYCGYTKAQNF